MQAFKLALASGATVTGIHNLPKGSSVRYRPLIVALHGGSYDCNYFDASPRYTASIASNAFGVPFVAIDRPCYGGTTSFLPVPEKSNFNRETGSWLHEYILPALWSEFGVSNNCTCIILLCHSLGAMGGIVAAAMHEKTKSPAYPLGGLVASGMGNEQPSATKQGPAPGLDSGAEYSSMPYRIKDQVMFLPGTVDEEIVSQSERLNRPSPCVELQEYTKIWLPTWKQDWAAHIKSPVMFALVQDDVFFEAMDEQMEICTSAFKNSVRVEGSLVKGPPHCMESSYWSQGWYARCFGFALECSASFAVDA
jgi:pimeloyl-ACP methyl ester carboxylesterase